MILLYQTPQKSIVKHMQHMILLYQTPQKSCQLLSNTAAQLYQTPQKIQLLSNIRHDTVISDTTKVNSCQTQAAHDTVISDHKKSTIVKHRQHMILLYQTPQKSCQLLSNTGSTDITKVNST